MTVYVDNARNPYGRYLMYGWMPVPDIEVIRSLVPQD